MLVLPLTGLATANAQQQEPQPTRDVLTPLTVHVVISRFQDQQEISSLPYVLGTNANGGRASLRMGRERAQRDHDVRPGKQGCSVPRSRIATLVSPSTAALARWNNGRYSIPADFGGFLCLRLGARCVQQPGPPDLPHVQFEQLLGPGGRTPPQFTMATDKLTGEVIKVEQFADSRQIDALGFRLCD